MRWSSGLLPACAADRRPRWRRIWLPLVAAAAAGGLLVAAFPPYDRWPLAVVSPAALALLCRGRSVRAGLALGLAYGLAFFVPLLAWTGTYVGSAPWLILAAAQAAYLALLAGGLTLSSRLPGAALWSAALWVAQEAVRSRAPFGGFPWGRLAFSQAGSPLAWFASYGGAPLVTFVVALLAGFGASLLAVLGGLAAARAAPAPPGPPLPLRVAAVSLGGIALLVALAPAARAGAAPPPTSADGQVTVAVIQGNVPRLGLNFNAQREAVLRNHVRQTLRLAADAGAGRVAHPDLVIWPENSSDLDPTSDPGAAALISQAARAVGVPILVGAVLDGPGPNHDRNVGIVWDPATGPGQTYTKQHPVPWGEYIPLRSLARLVSKDVDLVRRDMVAGDRPGVLRVGPATVADVICFEVAYDGIVRDSVRGGGGLIVVQTNNATFGRSHETWQQLAMGRLRAVEHGRAVLVAASSGISAVIRPDGSVAARSSIFTAATLLETVPVRAGTTLATRVGALPEWLLTGAGVAAVAMAIVRRRRRTPSGSDVSPDRTGSRRMAVSITTDGAAN